jgi:HD-GYP domain-containing protein (c-di-GMP phosphodiesterase class II)
MDSTAEPRHSVPPRTGGDPLQALASRLSRELHAPLGLLAPAGPTPAWVACAGSPDCRLPQAGELASRGGLVRATLWRPPGEDGPIWLGLPVHAAPRGAPPGGMVAWAGFMPAGATPDAWPGWGPSCPEPALRAWGDSISAALQRVAVARETPASRKPRASRIPTARLIGRLRVSDPPATFQTLAVTAARVGLGVDAAAWVPASAFEPVISAGDVEGLDSRTWRALAADASGHHDGAHSRICDNLGHLPWRVSVVADDAEAPAGWVVSVSESPDAALDATELDLIRPVASLIAAQRSNSRTFADLKDLLFGVIRALTSAIDAKDQYTFGHSERVARIAVRLGVEMGMSSRRRGDLYLAGLLHDVGKIGVDDNVLKKSGPLTPDEYRVIQSHVVIGVRILGDLKTLGHLLPGVAGHHESLDGSGYPAGLRGDEIPLEARILAVADTFDAMSSNRPYRRRLTTAQIDEVFRKGSGKQWDPRIVDALFACRVDVEAIRQKGLGESLQAAVSDTIGRK